MIPIRRMALYELFKATDICLMFCSLLAAYFLARLDVPPVSLEHLGTVRLSALTAASGTLYIGWLLSLKAAGLYRSHRRLGLVTELRETATGCSLSTVFVLCWLMVLHSRLRIDLVSCFKAAVLFNLFSTACVCLSRMIARHILIFFRKRGRDLRSVLIVGSSDRATGYADQLVRREAWGYRVLGFIDEDWYATKTTRWGREHLLGTLSELPELLRLLAVDEVILALPLATFYREAAAVTALCKEHGIAVTMPRPLQEEESGKPGQEDSDSPMVPVYESAEGIGQSISKRALDIVISFALLAALFPVLLTIGLVIVLTSPGPALFAQTRLGRGKRPFTIYKFRTMSADAERELESLALLNETGGPTFKASHDPRITLFGRFLRKTSLDELPQLFNVFTGDMSLVGPRPLPMRDYAGFSKDWHRRRFSVKPGITCLWQVMGRSFISFEEWMVLDMRYIDEWSLWLDLKILMMTIPAVLRGSGAV